MKINKLKSVFLLGIILFSAYAGFAQNTERIQASYLIAMGKLATGEELAYWNRQGMPSVDRLVAMHKEFISLRGNVKEEIIARSYAHTLGYIPSADEIKFHMKTSNVTYTEFVAGHLSYVKRYPGEYDKVINRAYKYVYGVNAPEEVLRVYRQNNMSFVFMITALQAAKKKNSYSLQGWDFGSLLSLATFAVSNFVFGEARNNVSATMVAAGGGNLNSLGGSNIVAAGGGNIVAAGGGNIVAAGGGNIVAAGGGN